jgi:hypothetical protein
MLKKQEIYKNKLLILFVIFLLLVLFFLQYKTRINDYSVEIISPNETIVQPLLKNQEIQVTGLQGNVKIQILNRKVYVLNSSCPDKVCVKAGAIDKPGPMIVCAPNRVVIRIVSRRIKPLVSY